jgi:hypothetical protein
VSGKVSFGEVCTEICQFNSFKRLRKLTIVNYSNIPSMVSAYDEALLGFLNDIYLSYPLRLSHLITKN